MTDHPFTMALTEEEANLINLLRTRETEIADLVEQDQIEKAAWEKTHPGQPYAALLVDQSSGSKGYALSAEAAAEMAEAAFDLAARRLGLTGWQASFAELDFLRRTRRLEGPFSLVDFTDALYPQYDVVARVEKTRNSRETIKWLGDCAEYALASKENFSAPQVRDHWRWLVEARDALPTEEPTDG